MNRLLALAIAALLTVGIGVGVVVSGDDDGDDKVSTQERSGREGAKKQGKKQRATTTTVGAGAGANDDADDPVSSDGGAAGSGGAGTSGDGDSGGTGSGSGSDPEPTTVDPAAPGTYTYDVDGETKREGALSGSEKMPPTAKLTVHEPDGTRQRSVHDGRDKEGEGTVTTTDLIYGDRGVSLAYLKIASRMGGISQTYEFKPDPPKLVAPADAEVGDHLEFDMESTDGGLKVHVEIDILDTERLTIGGEPVDTFKVRQVSTFRGDFEGKNTTIANLSPEHSLSVKDHTTSDIDAGVVQIHSESRSVLRSLHPA